MHQPFDLKGASFTIPMLSLREADMETIGSQLTKKVCQAPMFFHSAPLVVNLGYLPDPEQLNLPGMLALVREQGFIPVGITNGTEAQEQQAKAMNMAVLTTHGSGKGQEEQNPPSSEEEIDKPTATVIDEPIRSGQRVIVDQGDLIVMASVGSGAEVIAAGNIHVYGALRGRAFAGSMGDSRARIFCQHLEAELVAVAGVYLVNEDFPDSLRTKPVHICLQTERIRINSL
uniref:septum site-determining protein MinC n=1 Tax=Candidatus Electrothrix sp. TaxID=2170559 RepID=UPI0040561F82